jgi:hypothetical protein
MPFESLSCPHCGSGKVHEVKPGTYFCNHCDNVFKYVSPRQTGSVGGCELPVAGQSCGVTAIGRCSTCSRAYCATHQAHDLSTIGVVIQEYRDWCIECQQQRKTDERNLAQAKEKQQKEDRMVAAKRIPVLIAQFKAQPFTGAQNRDYVEKVAAGHAFLSSAIKYKSVTHQYVPAVPLGRLYWTCYVTLRDAWYDKPKQESQEWATGLNRNGEFVPMNTSVLHNSFIAPNLGYELARWQEVKICEYLEKLLGKTSQAAKAAAAQDIRYNLTADGEVNYADPK